MNFLVQKLKIILKKKLLLSNFAHNLNHLLNFAHHRVFFRSVLTDLMRNLKKLVSFLYLRPLQISIIINKIIEKKDIKSFRLKYKKILIIYKLF